MAVISMVAPALGLKTIPDLLDTNSRHTGIAYANLTTPHTCDYMGYVHHVQLAARSRNKIAGGYLRMGKLVIWHTFFKMADSRGK